MLTVATLQADLSRSDPEANLRRVLAHLEDAARGGARLVVLPEMWPTSFEPDAGEAALEASERAVEALRAASARLGLAAVGSAYGRGPDGRLTNRVHVVEDGRLLATYDKVHLFTPTAEAAVFHAGDAPPPVVACSFGRLAPLVCYDLRFPEVARAAFRGGAELLAVCAQWPAPRLAHWRALVVGRAVEGQWFVVAANRTGTDVVGRRGLELDFPGSSLVVDPDGAVLSCGDERAGVQVATVDLAAVAAARRAVPVARDDRPELYRAWR